jgi:uncharacterized membrane protein
MRGKEAEHMEKVLKEKKEAGAAGGVKSLVLAALFAALACVATMVLVVPSPTGGYMNLGDAVVLLGAFLLGPVYGAAAAGVGAALADLLAGYTLYVPATLVIKACMALLAGAGYRSFGRKALAPCAVASEAVMVVGYWLYDGFLMRSLTGAAVGIPSNLVQAAFGIVVSLLLMLALGRSSYVRRQFPNL